MRGVFLCIWVALVKNGFCLSSATAREQTMAVPTANFRRIFVNRPEGQHPLDLLVAENIQLRARRVAGGAIWEWDNWCQKQMKIGECKALIPRFYYNISQDACLQFDYGGCSGNKNNFENKMTCERRCKGTAYKNPKTSVKEVLCSLQPNPGLCLAYMPRYYYDINEGSCKKFIYGGCGGNDNKFTEKDKCNEYCKGVGRIGNELQNNDKTK